MIILNVSQVDKYLKEILQDVISNLTSNTWRIRESRYSNNTYHNVNIKLQKILILKINDNNHLSIWPNFVGLQEMNVHFF